MADRQRFDLCIVGSGPAGLAAASHAHQNGIDYVVLERGAHLADTIFCYQARKYVMAEPMSIPARGEVPFDAGSREQILKAWQDHVEARRLLVHYNNEVRSVSRAGDRFVVATTSGIEYESRWVIFAMGTQGAQRRPGVPGEELPHVQYRLIDPSEYVDQDVLVVGAGDSAIEIALALADDNRVGLVLRSPEIVRAKESLTKEILSRANTGQVSIYFNDEFSKGLQKLEQSLR